MATTWAHAVYSKEAYAPFGETYNEAGTPDRSFTGQDQDVASGAGGTGTYDFLFRKYDPAAGRWLSPDPAGWKAVSQAFPQSLNRYAYVQNNPMSLTDSGGLECVWDDGSYDAEDDVSTGNPGGCQGQGGTWIELGQNGDWRSNSNDILSQAAANIQSGFWTEVAITNSNNGSTNYTFYTSGGRALLTDTGGVLNGYSYFDNNDTNAILSKSSSDTGGLMGNWLFQRGQQLPVDPNDQSYRIQQLSNDVDYLMQHPLGQDMKQSTCEAAKFALLTAGGAATPMVEGAAAWGYYVGGILGGETVEMANCN